MILRRSVLFWPCVILGLAAVIGLVGVRIEAGVAVRLSTQRPGAHHIGWTPVVIVEVGRVIVHRLIHVLRLE